MILTLGQIASHATRMAGLPQAPLSLVSEYVNLAMNMLSNTQGVDLAGLETVAYASTSTGTDNARLATPNDFNTALALNIAIPNSWSTATSRTTDWRPLTKEPGEQQHTVWVQSASSGVPQVYAEYATWLELRPSPNSQYSIEMRYQRKLSDYTASTATFPIDDQWDWALALKAGALLAAAFVSDTSTERKLTGQYNAYVSERRTDNANRRADMRGMYVTFARTRR